MKKVFRFLGILILILVAAVVVLGLIAPKDVKIERSVMINGPKDVVADQMLKYNNYHNWNPWAEMDSNMKWDVTGEELTPGTKYHWTGENTGEGEMITKEVKGDGMVFALHFKEPMESEAEGYYKVEDAGNGQTKATQGFAQHTGFPMNGIMMVMNMTGFMEKTFDKGLNNLKAYVESGKAGNGGNFAIKEVSFEPHTYAAIRKTIGFNEMQQFFGESYSILGKEAGSRINGTASGIFYKWDEQTYQADAAAAFPVSGTEAVKGATMVSVPKSQAYLIEYKGGYTGSGKAHEALGKHMATNGKTQSMVIEEYIIGPEQEKDSTKWTTNIYYLLQ